MFPPKTAEMDPMMPAEPDEQAPVEPLDPYSDDKALLALFDRCKKESFEGRWIFERQWLRNIYYFLMRQWITWNSVAGEWQDKRLAKFIPRPVSTKPREIEQAIRAMLISVNIGVNIRPNGEDQKNVVTAGVADKLVPILHRRHNMDTVLNEAYASLIVLGDAFLHSYMDEHEDYGSYDVPQEQCLGCGAVNSSDKIAEAQQACPDCGQRAGFQQAGVETKAKRKAITCALTPLELAFPMSTSRWSEVPYVIRLRWRPKSYYENSESLKPLVERMNFQRSPSDRSLQIFKSMATQNDIGNTPTAWSMNSSGYEEEGISEYELWYKPCDKYPDGLVLRVVGDTNPQVVRLPEEGLPGPFPDKDQKGRPLFPFSHSKYQHVIGRIFGYGVIDVIAQKIDQINQLDSMIQMIIQRNANGGWMVPKGTEVDRFSGEPGWIMRYNWLGQGSPAPERFSGQDIQASLFQYRAQLVTEIEEASATFDILRGAKPAGVEAFSSLQFLDERGRARFAGTLKSINTMYMHWYRIALEFERAYGDDQVVEGVMSPTRRWSFQTFKNADLQGAVVFEEGNSSAKTLLGERATIQHLSQLQLINPEDPDQRYKIYQKFDQADLSPQLDSQVQSAIAKQEAFEQWAANPGNLVQMQMQAQADPNYTPTQDPAYPLRWRAWYDAEVHRVQFLEWANSDRIRQLLQDQPNLEGLLTAHLQEIDLALYQKAQGLPDSLGAAGLPPPNQGSQPGQPQPGGAGMAMENSAQNSAPVGNTPQPAMPGVNAR